MNKLISFRTNKSISGFTLIELLVTLAVIFTILGVGIPHIGATVIDNRKATGINDVVSSLLLTRSEAVKRGRYTILCTGNTDTGCSNDNKLNDGYIMFVDQNNNGEYDVGSSDILLRSYKGYKGLSITAEIINSTTNKKGWMRFNGRGNSDYKTYIKFCSLDGSEYQTKLKVISLSYIGRAKSLKNDEIMLKYPEGCTGSTS